MSTRPRVVILGGGFGGLGVLRTLGDAEVDVTLVDRNDYHMFQPLLYQVATAELGPYEVAYPLRDLRRHHPGLTFVRDEVAGIDVAAREIALRAGNKLPYDVLVVALGAVVNFFGTPGAAEHAYPLYTLDDATRLKARILERFEAASRDQALVADGALTFCVVGGGPTGVELAGALSELVNHGLAGDYDEALIRQARVVLYEHGEGLVQMFPPTLQAYAKNALGERLVEINLGVGVSQIAATRITLSTGAVVPTHTLAWAAGLAGNPLLAQLGAPLDRGRRVAVGPDLRLPGHPEVFVIGDAATMTDGATGKPLPGLGATALQAGKQVGHMIRSSLQNEPQAPFVYTNKGSMAQLGRGAAVAELPGGVTLTGEMAWLAWLGVHLALLNGVEERASTLVDWGWNFFTHGRSKRVQLARE